MAIKRSWIVYALVLVGTTILAGCAGDQKVTMGQMSAPAQATLQKVTAGGTVESIMREKERGQVVYDVEATVGGKHAEWLLADADGAVLGTETQIEFAALPAPVAEAAQKYFGTTTGLTVMKGVEYGETSYEVEGMKGGKKVEVNFDPTGKRTE